MTKEKSIVVLDKKDIAIVIKEDNTRELFIGSEIDEDAETEQNLTVVLIMAVLSNPEAYAKLLLEDLEKYAQEENNELERDISTND